MRTALGFRLARHGGYTCLAILMSLVAGMPAQAALISRDWKTPGDGLLTYDTVSQREWLDLSVTFRALFPALGFEAQINYILNETAPGGQFSGFRFASLADVTGLLSAAGITPEQPHQPIGALYSLVGGVYPGTRRMAAVTSDRDFSAHPSVVRYLGFTAIEEQSQADFGAIRMPIDLEGPYSVMLYRPVPEPSAGFLALAFFLIGVRAFYKDGPLCPYAPSVVTQRSKH